MSTDAVLSGACYLVTIPPDGSIHYSAVTLFIHHWLWMLSWCVYCQNPSKHIQPGSTYLIIAWCFWNMEYFYCVNYVTTFFASISGSTGVRQQRLERGPESRDCYRGDGYWRYAAGTQFRLVSRNLFYVVYSRATFHFLTWNFTFST